MIKSKYRWDMPRPSGERESELMAELGVGRLVAGVLARRDWNSPEEARAFLDPSSEELLDPYRMKGMAEAVERIGRAVREGERIRVYGDYDADGVTSTALMIRLLTELGASFDTYIPHRSREGYGLNNPALDLAAAAGVRLLITVDNGISAAEQIAYAASLGIDVVVTDHHEPPEQLPSEAVALVNPKQRDCPYPFKGLCGAGVVFKLAHAMLGRPVPEYADLAAIGTIADLMPLTGENRIIARMGLARLRQSPPPGIRALAQVAGIDIGEISSGRIGFSLAPRLNAGGRLEHADSAVKLLAASSEAEAEVYAQELDRLNTERQELVERTVEEADEMWLKLREADGEKPRRAIVLAKEGWNAGVAGLVASKLVERYYRPAVILAIDAETGLCKGSARSIDGFDLYAALTDCADLLEHYGGHQAAAGMTLRTDLVAELGERLDRIAAERLTDEDWQPKRRVDLCVALEEVTLRAVDQLAALEPFGSGNPTPRVVVQDVVIKECRTMGKENKHLRLTVEQAGRSLEVVAFGMGPQRDRMAPGLRVDLLGELSVNEWNGNRKTQMMFQDFRSRHLFVDDRRGERNPWAELKRLAAAEPAGLAVVCASKTAYHEAVRLLGPAGVPLGMYEEAEEADVTDAASEIAAASSGPRGGLPAELRHLVMLGLPGEEREAAALRGWLLPERGLERVTVFAAADEAREGRSSAGRESAFPGREHFAEVYKLCRKRGSWMDSPDGFLRETAEAIGWPLATVRMMHETFIELGFIVANGVARKAVASPPRKELSESARYRKAKEQAALRGLADMASAELRSWMAACHGVG
ncbi:single-stranded-DNA-specific exonuclease RecJ [Cohnella cellulosilytica]|uniref:Single-stranded-DNA-specific exonuclease RecJ n=1 Tax=Cohnella cellulosilytica TaxID=986710 RepID=A0ABW2FBS8_9BACL